MLGALRAVILFRETRSPLRIASGGGDGTIRGAGADIGRLPAVRLRRAIAGFTDGEDLIALAGGLTPASKIVTQGSGANASEPLLQLSGSVRLAGS